MLAPDVGLCTGYKGFIFLCWPLNNPKQVYNSTREISNPNKKVSVTIPPRGYAKQESKFGRQLPQNTENLTKYLTIYDQKSLIIAGNKTPDAQKFFFFSSPPFQQPETTNNSFHFNVATSRRANFFSFLFRVIFPVR